MNKKTELAKAALMGACVVGVVILGSLATSLSGLAGNPGVTCCSKYTGLCAMLGFRPAGESSGVKVRGAYLDVFSVVPGDECYALFVPWSLGKGSWGIPEADLGFLYGLGSASPTPTARP